jgi:hypothetical protein
VELAGRLDQLKTISGNQLTDADKALKVGQEQLTALDLMSTTAQAQLDAFNGISTMVQSIGEAMHAFDKATGKTGTASAADSVTTVGAGATVAASTAGQYADRINSSAGVISTWVSDADRVARLSSIEKYISATFDGSAESIKAIADTAKQYGVSQKDIAAASGYIQSDIEKLFLGVGVPAFSKGTNLIPSDMLAMVHQGEAIVPAAYNPANGGSMGNTDRLEALVAGLTAEVQRLQAIVATGNGSNDRIATAIEGNQSRPLLVEIAA